MNVKAPEVSKCRALWRIACFTTILDDLYIKLSDFSNHPELLPPSQSLLRIRWRIGQNLYHLNRYEESIRQLQAVWDDLLEIEDMKERRLVTKINAEQTHTIHLTIGRAAVQLYLIDFTHKWLEVAQQHYELAVQFIKFDLSAMIVVPTVLLEYGRVLEMYNSFDSSLDVYGRILTNFPTFRGYFDALYRTGIVALHIASVRKNDSNANKVSIEETIDKCVDIFQFLLEALPPHLEEIHVILLYARSFELSSSPQQRFRATGILSSFYESCKRRGIAASGPKIAPMIVKDGAKVENVLEGLKDRGKEKEEIKAWLSNPQTWLTLGKYFMEDHQEPILAQIAFNKFEDEARRRVPPGKDLAYVVGKETALYLAYHFRHQQQYTTALRFAELGLQCDRYDKTLRNLLLELQTFVPNTGNRWTNQIQREIISANKIIRCWRHRAWTPGFRLKLRLQIVASMEERLQTRCFDLEARRLLSYYARDQYRHRFLFEERCAERIQRAYREYRKYFVWQEAQRRHFATLASDAVYRFNRRPMSPRVRAEIFRLGSHRLVSKRHPIQTLVRSLQQQQMSIIRIIRCVKAFLLAREIRRRVQLRAFQRHQLYTRQAVRVQCLVRRFLARCRIARVRQDRALKAVAAVKVQRCYRRYRRHRKRHFLHRRLQRMQQRDRQLLQRPTGDNSEDDLSMSSSATAEQIWRSMKNRAQLTLKRLFGPHVYKYIVHRRRGLEQQLQRTRRFLERDRALHTGQRTVLAAMRIQRFYRSRVAGFWFAVTRKIMRKRRRRRRPQYFYERKTQDRHILHHMSPAGRLALYLDAQIAKRSLYGEAERLREWFFRNPGMNPLHADFQRLVAQEVIVFLGDQHCSFVNFQLLGMVLCHPRSRLRCLVLIDCDVFSPDQPNPPSAQAVAEYSRVFFKGLQQARALKSIVVLGGHWSQPALKGLFSLVQSENPRIETLCIEQVALKGGTAEVLAQRSGRLLCDYLNYSLVHSGLGGLRSLSLHGCGLWDSHLTELCAGLAVTAALEYLTLSLNLLSDDGLFDLLAALQANKHQPLRRLDLQDNLIRLNARSLRDALHAFRSHFAQAPSQRVSGSNHHSPSTTSSAPSSPYQLPDKASIGRKKAPDLATIYASSPSLLSSTGKRSKPALNLSATAPTASAETRFNLLTSVPHYLPPMIIDLRRNPVAEPFDAVESALNQQLPMPQLSVLQDAVDDEEKRLRDEEAAETKRLREEEDRMKQLAQQAGAPTLFLTLAQHRQQLQQQQPDTLPPLISAVRTQGGRKQRPLKMQRQVSVVSTLSSFDSVRPGVDADGW